MPTLSTLFKVYINSPSHHIKKIRFAKLTCGGVGDGLIEIGADVLNLQQPRVLGIECFGQRFAGKVAFESLRDIQRTLPFKKEIEEARLLIDYWSTPQGGFILGDYGGGEAVGVSLESKHWVYDAFQFCDRWKTHVIT